MFGETREEYRGRISKELGIKTLTSNTALLGARYAKANTHIDAPLIDSLRNNDLQALHSLRKGLKFRALINPASVTRIFSNGGW
jgi:hypothetical protein